MSLKFTTCRHNGTIKEINNNDEKKKEKNLKCIANYFGDHGCLRH